MSESDPSTGDVPWVCCLEDFDAQDADCHQHHADVDDVAAIAAAVRGWSGARQRREEVFILRILAGTRRRARIPESVTGSASTIRKKSSQHAIEVLGVRDEQHGGDDQRSQGGLPEGAAQRLTVECPQAESGAMPISSMSKVAKSGAVARS